VIDPLTARAVFEVVRELEDLPPRKRRIGRRAPIRLLISWVWRGPRVLTEE
jgi:hypothetical protein